MTHNVSTSVIKVIPIDKLQTRICDRRKLINLKRKPEPTSQPSMVYTPTPPVNLHECIEALNNTKRSLSITISGSQFYRFSLTTDSGGVALVFASTDLQAITQGSTNLVILGSNNRDLLPCGVKYLLTFLTTYKSVRFPVITVLINKIGTAEILKSFYACKNLLKNSKVENITTHFDRLLLPIAGKVFNESSVNGSWSYYALTLMNKAVAIGLKCHESKDIEAIIRMCIALPFVPSTRFYEGWNFVQQFANKRNLAEKMKSFFDYYNKTWIEGIGPERLCSARQRSVINDPQPTYQASLYEAIGMKQPDLWSFLEGLRAQENSYVQYAKGLTSNSIGLEEEVFSYLNLNESIEYNLQKLSINDWSIGQCLLKCADCIDLQTLNRAVEAAKLVFPANIRIINRGQSSGQPKISDFKARKIQIFKGKIRDTYIIYDGEGYFYHKYKDRQRKSYVRCIRGPCPGRGICTYPLVEGCLLTGSQPHNHPPDPHQMDVYSLKRRILERCSEDFSVSCRAIYNEECSRFPDEVTRRVPYSEISSTAYKKRRDRQHELRVKKNVDSPLQGSCDYEDIQNQNPDEECSNYSDEMHAVLNLEWENQDESENNRPEKSLYDVEDSNSHVRSQEDTPEMVNEYVNSSPQEVESNEMIIEYIDLTSLEDESSKMIVHDMHCSSQEGDTTEIIDDQNTVMALSEEGDVSETYECGFCYQKFQNERSLEVHERLHAGLKPYLCHFCECSFETDMDFVDHQKNGC